MRGFRPKWLWAMLLWPLGQAPAFAAATPPSAAQQPAWSVDVQPDQCVLTHPINSGELSAFAIQSWAGEDVHQVVIEASAFPFPETELFQASVSFQPGGSLIHQRARAWRLKGNPGSILMMAGVSDGFLDALAHASAITVARGSKEIGPISLPNSQRAIAAFQKCLHDQLVAWGADAAQFEHGGQPPVALVSRDEFVPNETLLQVAFSGQNLNARFKLGVGLNGTIDSCERIDMKSTDNVEHVICRAVMARKLFSPAKNPAGAAVNGIATFHVTLQQRPN